MDIHRLRALREGKGISQGEAAKRMGIVRTTYSNYEVGNREPDNYTLKILADFYEVTTDYLLGKETIEKTARDIENENLAKLIISIKDPEKKKAAIEYLKFLAGQNK